MSQRNKLSDSFRDGIEPIATRTNGLNASIKEIDQRRKVLNRRLGEIEKRYSEKFYALESLRSKLRNTGDYLRQQLAALSGATRG